VVGGGEAVIGGGGHDNYLIRYRRSDRQEGEKSSQDHFKLCVEVRFKVRECKLRTRRSFLVQIGELSLTPAVDLTGGHFSCTS